MDSDTVFVHQIMNPCCRALKERYSKLEEKRKALRDAVKIQGGVIDKLQIENLTLQKAYEVEKVQVVAEREEKSKESAARVSLEKEMDVLKNEIHTLHQREGLESRAQDVDSELLLLRTRLSKKEAEIKKLKKLVKEEKVHADAEREEKRKESANRVLLEKEIVVLKSEIHSLHRRGDFESRAQDVDSELLLLQRRLSEKEAEIEKLKELVEEEKVHADVEREEKYKESANRVSLEKAIVVLKCEIHSLQQRAVSESNTQVVDNEISLLTRHAEMEAEIIKLKELVEEEKVRTDAERQEKNKELANRMSLAKEIDVLKTEIHSLHQREGSTKAEMEAEIDKLKKLVEKEKMKSDCEKKKADAEKKVTAKVNQMLKVVEKSKIDEERRRAKAEWKKVEENRALLEKLKGEAEEARSQLVLQTLKSEEANKKHESERQKALNEKRRVDVAMTKVEDQRKLMEMYKKKVEDEKHRADHLSQQLEEHKQKIQNLQKQVQENVSLRKFDDTPTDLSGKLINLKGPKSSGIRLDTSGRSPDESSLAVDYLNSGKVNERLKEEKQKVLKKRKNADSEMNKAELLKKVAEVDENKALEETHRPDQVSRQLEDQAHKIDQLQKEVSILLSSRSPCEVSIVNSEMNINSKTSELEMMKKHLKLKKKQMKHAKEVAKLERDRNMLQRKLSSITYEFGRFLQHINVLDDSLTTEGRDTSNKNNVYNSSRSNLQRELLSKYPTEVPFYRDNEPIKSYSLAMDISGTSKLAINCSTVLLPAIVGNSTQGISGIDSKMDSLLSERKKLQSSAINSTMASFSDRPLMASQGKGSLCVTTSAKLPEGNTNRQSKVHNLAVPAENSGQSLMKTDDTKSSKHSRKRKSITDAVKSIEHLYSEGKKWQTRLEGKISNLHCILQSQTDKSLPEKSNLKECPEEISAKKRKKDSSVEEVALQLPDDCENRKGIDGNGGNKVYNDFILPYKQIKDAARACEDGICDFGRNSREMGSFEEVMQGNFIKLLDLDDAVDEECYRRALERPLSPFVPVIEFQMSDATEHRSGDVINNRNCDGGTVYQDIASAQHIGESDKVMGISDYATNMSGQNTLQLTSNKPPKYCVVFSDSVHESSISRIYCAVKTCIDQCSVTFQMDEAILKLILSSLKMETLSLRERASVLFSVLLNFSETTMEVWNTWPTDFIQLSDSLAGCLHTVLSDAETWSRFAELCFSGELLKLIEEFLLDRRFLVYTDVSSESSPISGFRVNILLEEEHIALSGTLASRCQLLPGSVILASICAATDHIGFLCEASQNIFKLHKLDNSLVLDILHIFAYVCGPKYFTIEDYSLTMTVVRSLVTLLERDSVKRGHACCLSSSVKVCEEFTSLTKCPFSEVAVSMDEVISLLLEKLQNYVLSGVVSQAVEPGRHENNTQAHESQPMLCNVNCCLTKFGTATGQSDSLYDHNICHFMDIISLVELVSSNMHWDWTCKQIIPLMFKLLDLCPLGNFFTVIVTFLGNLGRLGVDASGYDDKAVESLRSRLSASLNQNSTKKLAFTTQVVIINALVGTVPVNFEKLVNTDVEIPSFASYLNVANCIRNWYSTLSSEQQSLSLGLLVQPVSKVAELFSSQVQL